MLWSGWGLPERRVELDVRVRALLKQALGLSDQGTPAVPAEKVHLPDSRLDSECRAVLAGLLGARQVRLDRAARLLHLGGKSTPDLLRIRTGMVAAAPDAVVLPGTHDEVLAVLGACAQRAIAVVPFGGGTSVVGGVEPISGELSAVIALDLRRLDALVSVDRESMTATLQAGMRALDAERLLAAHGLSLGHFPQSYEHATIGGFAATRSAGQASTGYGRFDEMVIALRVATPSGTIALGRAPASAAGPDLRQLFLGSEGTLGVITEVTVRVHPVPAQVVDEAWTFADFATAAAVLRELAQRGLLPAVARVSDEAETFVNLTLEGQDPLPGCTATLSYEGAASAVVARRAAVGEVAHAHGAARLAGPLADHWRTSRYQAPYLRDALLDAGALVETLETATSWSNLARLYAAVRDALTVSLVGAGTPPLVLCHISHVYTSGASLYFTVACRAAADPLAQWSAAKFAAGEAIVASGATITHHHAVGTEHRRWMTAEIGDLGVAVLRAVKAAVDPAGILNPGKLIPDG